MIRWTYAFLDRPADGFEAAAAFWCAVTGTTLSARRGLHQERATLLPAAGDACLKVQAVGDAGGVHLDLCVDDVRGLAGQAVELGAAVEADHGSYLVLSSPSGHLFCAVPWRGEADRPAPVEVGTGGATSRADQVTVDVAPGEVDAEVAFWSSLTGWAAHPGALPGFSVVRPSAELPIRILVQRLDEERPTSAHLDLACSDVPAVRAFHESLGAAAVAERPLWTVMRDPAGGTYCLTARDPATGSLPA